MIADDEVHLWVAPLDPPPDELGRLAASLSAEERARAARLRHERARRRFTAARGVLRGVLGRYLDVPPGAVRFEYGPRGKPSLAAPHAAAGLRFNVSHSGELGIYAVARGREVGVDVERLRPVRDALRIARRFLSPPEAAALAALPPARLDEAFLACWTRKEAFVKAVGRGVTLPLDGFVVPLEGDVDRVECPPEMGAWSLAGLRPADGFVGALVVEQAPGAPCRAPRVVERGWGATPPPPPRASG